MHFRRDQNLVEPTEPCRGNADRRWRVLGFWFAVERHDKTFSGYGGLQRIELAKLKRTQGKILVHITAARVAPLEYTGDRP
jgi:hypothetical protein